MSGAKQEQQTSGSWNINNQQVGEPNVQFGMPSVYENLKMSKMMDRFKVKP